MHELMACAASLILLSLMITQTAANTNTFIEAAYCSKTIEQYASEEYEEEEIPFKMRELEEKLEMMPGIEASISGGRMKISLAGVIGPSKVLGIKDNRIVIERTLELKVKEPENEESDNNSGDPDPAGGSGKMRDLHADLLAAV